MRTFFGLCYNVTQKRDTFKYTQTFSKVTQAHLLTPYNKMNRLLIKVKFGVYFLILRLSHHIALSSTLYDGKRIHDVSFISKNHSDPTAYF